jgi:hypothetical protein
MPPLGYEAIQAPQPPGYEAAYAPQPPGYGQPYVLQPGMPGPLYLAPTTSVLATISLIAGILGFFFVPFIGSLVAVICGHLALIEIDRSQGQIRGRGLALVGVILGYIGLAFIVVGIAVIVYLIKTTIS